MSSNKKQRLNDDNESSKACPRGQTDSFLGQEILRQPKQAFLTGLGQFDISQNDAHQSLNQLEDKVHEVASWIVEYKIKLQRDERCRRKAQREEGLRAIYQHQQQEAEEEHPCCFTLESAMAVLDSGFLSAGEIGKLCLLTGKFFFASLQLDHNYVWQKIFEAKFKNDHDRGLKALYTNQKFKPILDRKGCEWAFRNLFAVEQQSNQRESPALSLRANHEPLPAATLNSGNVMFAALFQNSDDYGFLETNHVELIDDKAKIEELLAGDNNRCETPVCDAAIERIFRCQDNVEELYKADYADYAKWKDELKKRLEANPRLFHPKLISEFQKEDTRQPAGARYVAWFMFRYQISVIALRMDTQESTTLWEATNFEIGDGSIGVYEDTNIPLNGIGKTHTKNLLLREFDHVDDSPWMELDLSVDVHDESCSRARRSICLAFHACCTIYEQDMETSEKQMNLYHILDYGMDWE